MASTNNDRLGRTELHYAAAKGDVVFVQELLEAGNDANAADKDGRTPLHFASQAFSSATIEKLILAGAKVDTRDGNGNTPLSNAVFNSHGKGDAIRVLREAGADPHAKNNFGVSPLNLARQIANYNVAQYFADLTSDGNGGGS